MIGTRLFKAFAASFLVCFGSLSAQASEQSQGEQDAPTEVCQLSLRAPSDLNWRGPRSRGYEADHAGLHGENIPVEVRRSGAQCSYTLEVTPIDSAYVLTGNSEALSFLLRAPNGETASSPSAPLEIEASDFGGSSAAYLNFTFEIEPGQQVRAGRYAQELSLVLYDTKDGARRLADSRLLRIHADVWPRVLASVGPSALSKQDLAEIDLGLLRAGAETPFDFSVSANAPYQVTVQSENAGRLKHFRSEATVAYELFLDGQRVDPASLGSEVIVSSGKASRRHEFKVRIGNEGASVPAGQYHDRLTVTISAG